MLSETEIAARGLHLQLQQLQARGRDDFDGAFSAMIKERTQALLVLGDAMFWFHRTRLADLAVSNRLPTMFAQREHVEAAASWPTESTFATTIGGPRPTWPRSSTAASLAISRSNSPPSSNW
jgi:hypothetical protein